MNIRLKFKILGCVVADSTVCRNYVRLEMFTLDKKLYTGRPGYN